MPADSLMDKCKRGDYVAVLLQAPVSSPIFEVAKLRASLAELHTALGYVQHRIDRIGTDLGNRTRRAKLAKRIMVLEQGAQS